LKHLKIDSYGNEVVSENNKTLGPNAMISVLIFKVYSALNELDLYVLGLGSLS
jgi:hypothetical protein